MVFRTEKEYRRYKNRNTIVMCAYAVAISIFAILGYPAAFNEKINGFIGCDESFRFVWNCFCIPMIMAVASLAVKDVRKMLVTVMALKAAATLFGLLLGINPNIHLPVFKDDWGALFFVLLDIFLAVTIYKERNERMLINGASIVLFILTAVSQIICFVEWNLIPEYAFRSAYAVLFYRAIYTVICHITPNVHYLPNSHEKKRIEKQVQEMGEDKDA